MAAPRKPKSPLQRVPTRKLVAGIKRDLKKMLRAGTSERPANMKKGKD